MFPCRGERLRANWYRRCGLADRQLEASFGIGLRAADSLVFLIVVGVDRLATGESHADGPDGKYRGLLNGFVEMIKNAAADGSPLLEANHRLDPVFSGRRGLTENRLGDVTRCENARGPALMPLDRRAESRRRASRSPETPGHLLRVF